MAMAANELTKRDANLVGRQIKNSVMLGLCIAAAAVGLISLFLVLYFLASQGLRYLNWNLLTKLPDAVDPKKGGVANSILGTLALLAVASLFALPIGILGGIYQLEAKGRFANIVRFMTDVLNGIPVYRYRDIRLRRLGLPGVAVESGQGILGLCRSVRARYYDDSADHANDGRDAPPRSRRYARSLPGPRRDPLADDV